jgi:replicative DNA helicase
MSDLLEKIPPHDIDAEQSVLGAMLLDREAVNRVARFLNARDFYLEAHKSIFEAMMELDESGRPADLVTVTDFLRRKGLLEKVGGATYLASLLAMVPSTANAEFYGHIVEEKSLLRNMIHLATRLAGMGYKGSEDVERLMDEAERMINELAGRRATNAFSSLKEVLHDTLKHIQFMYQNKGEVTGVPTGFKELDRLCAGLQPSDLVIVAARPSMGKTSFGLSIAYHAAINQGQPVALFSMEMSKEQLVQRMLCSAACIDQQRVRTGFLKENDWIQLTAKAREMTRAPIYIDDSAMLTVRQIRAKARRLQVEKNLGLIVIDYLQLMHSGRRTENRQQEIADISRSLKGLAKELNVPVVALAQLSRSVEQRQNKRPMLSDLRESGSLEQDADVVVFIYRDDYYNPESEKRGLAEIIIAKQRSGPVGKVELAFVKEYTKFMNLSRREEPGGAT